MAEMLYVPPLKENMTALEVATALYGAFKDRRGATLAGDEALDAYERHVQQMASQSATMDDEIGHPTI